MISVQNRERVEGWARIAEESVELIGKESAIVFGTSSFGFAMSYHRATSIRSRSSGVTSPIRDHVMIFKLGAMAVLGLSMARRYFNG